MAKSKKRGGEKAHRVRVTARNQRLKSAQSKMQQLFNEAMQKEIEAMKAKESTENTETTEPVQ